jgi:hypothetical protein
MIFREILVSILTPHGTFFAGFAKDRPRY